MHAIVCVTGRFAQVFVHQYNDEKMEGFKGFNHFPDLCVYFKQISVEKNITALLRVVRKY